MNDTKIFLRLLFSSTVNGWNILSVRQQRQTYIGEEKMQRDEQWWNDEDVVIETKTASFSGLSGCLNVHQLSIMIMSNWILRFVKRRNFGLTEMDEMWLLDWRLALRRLTTYLNKLTSI